MQKDKPGWDFVEIYIKFSWILQSQLENSHTYISQKYFFSVVNFLNTCALQEDLLIHGDSVYDIIEKQDHQAIQTELMRSSNPLNLMNDSRIFLCRMNVSRNARRQMRFGDQKVGNYNLTPLHRLTC